MRFRTRTQEVEAIQYTGGNAAEVMTKCPVASAHSDGHGREWIQVLDCDNERVMARPGDYILTLDGGWAATDGGWFESRYEPIPDLIRTVEDYEGLPDGTILEVVEVNSETTWVTAGAVGVVRSGRVVLTGRLDVYGPYQAFRAGLVCSVVRLGGGEQ